MQPRKSKILFILHQIGVAVAILLPAAIAGAALWYRAPGRDLFGLFGGSWIAVAIWAIYVAGTLYYTFRGPHRPLATGVFMLVMAGMVFWWTSIKPQNYRYWMPEFAHIVEAEVEGDTATLKNVRNFTWRSPDDYDAKWTTRRYNVADITGVDLYLSYWGMPAIAHTLVGFTFGNGDSVVFSVETRKEEGEAYSNIAGFFKEYELALIAADPRDIIALRTDARGEDVYRYPITMLEPARRALFLSYLDTARDLRKHPRFYNTLTANCTTVAFHLVQTIVPGLPLDYRVLLSGYLPEYLHAHVPAYAALSVEDMRKTAKISD